MKLAFTRITLLVALICAIFSGNVRASHIAAVDLWIVYTGTGADGCTGTTTYPYDVYLTIYSACEPNSSNTITDREVDYLSDNAAALGLPNPSGTIPLTLLPREKDGQPNSADTVHSLCPIYDWTNACKDDANQHLPAYRKWKFKGNVTLPYPQTDWVFSYTTNARNSLIRNISPAATSTYIEAKLNNFHKYNNSTAQFKGDPLPYICVNTNTTFANEAFSPDGDSLIVVPQPTLVSKGVPNIWQTGFGGFNLSNPVASSTGYTFDSTTGTAYFRPTQSQVGTGLPFVLGFRAEEYQWQTGIELSYIMRDVQISVLTCKAPPPILDSLPTDAQNASVVHNSRNNKNFYIYGCPGNEIKFDVYGWPDTSNPFGIVPTGNNIYLYTDAQNVIPGSAFNVTNDGTKHPKGTFTWTPGNNDLGDKTIAIYCVDSTCSATQPVVLTQTRNYIIRIAKGLDAGDDLTACQFGGRPTQLFVKGAEFLRVKWRNLDGSPATTLNNDSIPNPLDDPKDPVLDHGFIVSSSDLLGECKSSDTVMVLADKTNSVDIVPQTPYVLCRPDYLQLDAVTHGPRPLTNLECGTKNPIVCKKEEWANFEIFGSPTYGKAVAYDTLGPNTPVFPNYEVKTSKQQYYISKGDLWEMGLRSSTITGFTLDIVDAPNPNHEYNNFKISMKCTGKKGISKEGGFENFMTQVYASPDPVTFPLGAKQFTFDTPYTWDTTQNLIIEICYANNNYEQICANTAGTAPRIRFTPTEEVGTLYLKRYFTTADVCGVLTHDSIVARPTRPKFTFHVCEPNDVKFEFKWTAIDPRNPTDSSAKFLSDSTIQQPLAYVPKTITYFVETQGRSTCILRDSIAVYVPEHDYRLIPRDTVICYGETANMRVNSGFDFKWYEFINGQYIPATSVTCFNCREVELKPEVTTTYKVVVYDSVWCIDTLTTTVKVLPLPDIKIINNDTIIKYGQSIQLLASGARMYNWTPVAPLNNANISYPIARPTESTKFVVGGIGANGCRAFDTLDVSVDTRDNLFIPSGFSPNGDGKNDMFRIANLTFQRVQEFRVFNRWGQEIYNSNTNNGWDGTWKGQPQEVGNYSYQIRIALPDGFVESFKGEVSLIR